MLIKFEQKTARVKGLAFHPKRPWLLTSLHNGTVQIWDYRMGTLIHSYSEHEGPVRSCAFHSTQPLFVTGGDDGKVKLWNWQQRKCVYTFTGHQDYIRTVQFHDESPWIISASDDQTIRIWNWQSRQCIFQLTGHSHYVMSAFFHPKDNLVISASLDQTIRIWDISGLKRRRTAFDRGVGGSGSSSSIATSSSTSTISGSGFGGMGGIASTIDLFSGSEAQVKFILEGHDRGVNWAQFHPDKPLIISGSDDRTIRLWKYNESRAWETDVFRGHHNNVSCVTFHPKLESLISNGEDKTMRLWNMNSRGGSGTILLRKDSDRFWTITHHQSVNLFAAGHDSGFIIFKLERERPGFAFEEDLNRLYILRESGIQLMDLSKKEIIEKNICTFEKPIQLSATIQLIPSEQQMIISNNQQSLLVSMIKGQQQQSIKGSYATLYGRNKWISLDYAEQKLFLSGSVNPKGGKQPIDCPIKTSKILPTPINGQVILIGKNSFLIYDANQEKIIHEIFIPDAKQAIWATTTITTSTTTSILAIIAKDAIYILNCQNYEILHKIDEKHVKSACWNLGCTTLFFTTSYHLKFLILNGNVGIIQTLREPCYLFRMIKSDTIQILTRSDNIPKNIIFDPTEYQFKLALSQNDLTRVQQLIQTGNLAGQAIILYLKNHNWSSIALEFVNDPKERLELAIESANLQEALAAAEKINKPSSWIRLAQESLKLGDHLIAELAYRKTNLPSKALFLRLISGQSLDEGVKMETNGNGNGKDMKMSMEKSRNSQESNSIKENIDNQNENTRNAELIQTCIFNGDQFGLSKLLKDKLPVLSFLALKSLERESEAQSLLGIYGKECNYPYNPLVSTKHVYCNETPWPLMSSELINLRPFSTDMINDGNGNESGHVDSSRNSHDSNAKLVSKESLGFEDLQHYKQSQNYTFSKGYNHDHLEGEGETLSDIGGGMGWDDLKIPSLSDHHSSDFDESGRGENEDFDERGEKIKDSMDEMGTISSRKKEWIAIDSPVPFDHVATGRMEKAIMLLERQAGIVSIEPLNSILDRIKSLCTISWNEGGEQGTTLLLDEDGKHPRPIYDYDHLESLFKSGLSFTTLGKFTDAIENFTLLLHTAPFSVLGTDGEAANVSEWIQESGKYIVGLKMELKRKELQSNSNNLNSTLSNSSSSSISIEKQILLQSCWFSRIGLRPEHQILALRSAMTVAFKLKIWRVAAIMASKLCEETTEDAIYQQARKVIQLSERATEREPFEIEDEEWKNIDRFDAKLLAPINGPSKECPYCSVQYQNNSNGNTCSICLISQIGKKSTGLVLTR